MLTGMLRKAKTKIRPEGIKCLSKILLKIKQTKHFDTYLLDTLVQGSANVLDVKTHDWRWCS